MIKELWSSHHTVVQSKLPESEVPSVDYQNVNFVINETPAQPNYIKLQLDEQKKWEVEIKIREEKERLERQEKLKKKREEE